MIGRLRQKLKKPRNADSVGVDGPDGITRARQGRPSVDQISRIGMHTSKQIFQLRANTAEQPVLRKKLRRKEMFALLEKLAPTVIAIEACGAKPPLCTAAGIVRAFGEVDRAAPGQAVH